jgi:hypothetical protein
MSFLKKKDPLKAKTVSQAIDMCAQFVQNNNNITIRKWGHIGATEKIIVTQKDKEIFKLERRINHRICNYSIKGFWLYGYIDEEDTEFNKAKSLFDLCVSKRQMYKSQKAKQSIFTRIKERIRS